MSTSQNMSKAERRDAARAEALSLQKKQQAREKTTRLITLGLLGALVIFLGVVVWFIVQEGQKSTMERVDRFPAGVVEETGIAVGASGAAGERTEDAPRLDVYVDYMCPICGQFEQTNGASIDELRESGEVDLVIHPVAILDRVSQGTEYSTRAASAAAWVADQAPEAFEAYNDLLFANQPPENTGGLTNAQLGDLAEQAGASSDVAGGIASGEAEREFSEWVTAVTADVQTKDFFGGTPTVLIDGEKFQDWQTVGNLTQAISQAG
ncbi:DsbA family protein [Antribacter gilvus]|uniref:DsbA family protein n=1 Tax=Antribacter gilvus TaxID=2304675 RepID=UPI000F79452E|nr:thioredoxin domain-containing protein [Antribacter gilvus]